LDRLRGGLIVSVQAEAGSVLDTPETIALLARCAVANGAVGVRVEGVARIAAVRAAVDVPIVGIVKRAHPGFAPYITSTCEEIAEVAAAGSTIAAFDATARPHSGGASVRDLVVAAAAHGLIAMADCATAAELAAAAEAGAAIVATTLSGYTADTAGRSLPALDLVATAARTHPFVVCEGGIGSPDEARASFAMGASAIVVGTAITNVDALVRRFAAAAPRST
jgi:N-acylglucosamine-6-phosphate 2-epimerase